MSKAPLVRMVLLANRGRRVILAPLVRQDPKAMLVHQVKLVRLVLLEQQANRDLGVSLASKAQWVRRVLKAMLAHRAKLVLWVQLVPLVRRAKRVLRVLSDLRARRETMVRALPFLEVMKTKRLCVKRILREVLAMRILYRETCTFGRKRRAIGIM